MDSLRLNEKGHVMNTIRIRTQIESTTLHLPELSTLLGKTVEIVVVESSISQAAPISGPMRFAPGIGGDPDLMEEALAESGALSRLA
jgi:hypothetical protein